jgi:hypothetical protein
MRSRHVPLDERLLRRLGDDLWRGPPGQLHPRNADDLDRLGKQNERLAPDGCTLIWNCFPEIDQPSFHAHSHVIPRFDDEPLADRGGRSAIKVGENRRPDPSRPGSGRAWSFGRPGWIAPA